MRNSRPLILFALIAGLTGCGGYHWAATTGLFASSKYDFSMKTPEGWHQFEYSRGVVFTRHGTGLERVSLMFYPWGDTLWTKKKSFARNQLLHELSGTFLADMRSCGAYRMAVTRSDVDTLDSMVSTKTMFVYLDPDGMPMRGVMVCVPMPKQVFVAMYTAADRVYYEKSLPVFETMMSTILFSPGVRKARVKEFHEIESMMRRE
jgi:hypothetical protein